MPGITAILGPCGAGKTTYAASRLVADYDSVLYVAPTRALAQQFAGWVRNQGIDVHEIFGRRLGQNCVNPLADIAIASGSSHVQICSKCPEQKTCDYWLSRGVAELWPKNVVRVAVTTLHFIAHVRVPSSDIGIAIYDDIFPMLSSPRRFTPDAELMVASVIEKKTIHYVPRLPLGSQGTFIISATPAMSLFGINNSDVRIEWIDNEDVALDQTVHVHLAHLTHTSRWLPPPGGCGFKKNTPSGLPYFHASAGLGDWRGSPLTVAGTFMPPVSTLSIIAQLLTQIYHEPHSVSLIPIIMEFARGVKIPSAMWGVHNHEVVIDASCGPSIYPLVQLLGRSGRGVHNTYYGDLPLNFRVVTNNTTVRLAREVVLDNAPPEIVGFLAGRHQAALALHGMLKTSRLSGSALKYYAFAQRVVEANQTAN